MSGNASTAQAVRTSTHLSHLAQLADHLDARDDPRLQRASTALVQQVHLVNEHQRNLQAALWVSTQKPRSDSLLGNIFCVPFDPTIAAAVPAAEPRSAAPTSLKKRMPPLARCRRVMASNFSGVVQMMSTLSILSRSRRSVSPVASVAAVTVATVVACAHPVPASCTTHLSSRAPPGPVSVQSARPTPEPSPAPAPALAPGR